MKKVLIIGANGQLGTALSDLFEKEGVNYVGKDLPEFDLTSSTLENNIEEIGPDVIINCAAYNNVYKAPEEIEKAFLINSFALKYLSNICNKNNIYLCHLSSDYVFDGKKGKPYIETDLPNPVNIYGLSKYVGERIVQINCNNFCIVRTAALYGKSKNNTLNVVEKLVQIAKGNKTIKLVKDEYTSPTFAADLAKQIHKIIENKLTGILHATNSGFCNWVEFGKFLFKKENIETPIEEIPSGELNSKIKKPLFSVLDNSNMKNNNLDFMPNWIDSLTRYLDSK